MTEEAKLPDEGAFAGVGTRGRAVGHIVPARVLVSVWAVLVALTGATVAVTWVDFGGSLNLWVAMAIATFKAALVLLYFMHLRYDHPIHAMVFVFTLFFVALFIGASLQDSQYYRGELIPGYAPDMTR